MELNDPRLLETRGYIDGKWVGGASSFEVRNPANNKTIAEVADLNVSDTVSVIHAAKQAQKTWAALTGKERAKVLRHWHDLIIENASDLARILTSEMGKPLKEAHAEILYGASFIEWFAEEAKRIYGEVIPGHTRDTRLLVLKQPVGVVGAITPWNFPNAMIARKVAPALAVGCTFIVRPSELTPLSALALAVLAERAGIPKGVFNVLPSSAPQAIGEELCRHPDVAKITFTGSTQVGKILMRQSSETIKKLSLELGGNAPFIVFDDTDIDAAVEGAMDAKYRNGGQTCVCANRIYVQSGVYDAFAEKLREKVSALTLGDGTNEQTEIGPMINDAAVQKIEAHITDAVSKGAEVITGGTRSPLGETFFEPTVITGVTQQMIVAKNESFGPIAPLFRFDNEADVLRMANDSEFGLAAYFYTSNNARVWRVAEGLEVGMVGVNTGLISTEVAPFGGIKQSGLGREGSRHGCDDYLEIKYVCAGGVS